jgi:hypothetical protein
MQDLRNINEEKDWNYAQRHSPLMNERKING